MGIRKDPPGGGIFVPHQLKTEPTMKKKIFLGLALLFVIILLVSVSSGDSETASDTTTTKTSVATGSEGYLRISTANDVAVMRTPQILDEFVKAATTNDTYGQKNILLDNTKSFFVPVGTKVLVIDKTFTTVKVRILEGKQTGEAGWVPTEFVKPN